MQTWEILDRNGELIAANPPARIVLENPIFSTNLFKSSFTFTLGLGVGYFTYSKAESFINGAKENSGITGKVANTVPNWVVSYPASIVTLAVMSRVTPPDRKLWLWIGGLLGIFLGRGGIGSGFMGGGNSSDSTGAGNGTVNNISAGLSNSEMDLSNNPVFPEDGEPDLSQYDVAVARFFPVERDFFRLGPFLIPNSDEGAFDRNLLFLKNQYSLRGKRFFVQYEGMGKDAAASTIPLLQRIQFANVPILEKRIEGPADIRDFPPYMSFVKET